MLDKYLERLLNVVLWGIEGLGKTQMLIDWAIKNATRTKPVLFAYKDYKLLRENRKKLIEKYGVPEDEICVCGSNRHYEEALKSYTNPDKPMYMESKARFILCTQAVVQRKRHLDFVSAGNHKKGFAAIVVDEFEFKMVTIPTLKYQSSRISDETVKINTTYDIMESIRETYSQNDYDKLTIAQKTNDRYKNFVVSDWITSSTSPIVFLTSETLAARFLKVIGFKLISLKSPDYKHCLINVHSSDNVVSEFYDVMNEGNYWKKLYRYYDVIVSDKAVVENNEECEFDNKFVKDQTVNILNHTIVKGTNNWIGKQMLTILSHVPSQVLDDIKDRFRSFGDKITETEIYQLFYRDRLCQAVGRCLGARGSIQTDLLVHSSIIESVMQCVNFPYSFNLNWSLPHDNLDEIWEKTIKLRQQKKQNRKLYEEEKLKQKVERTYSELEKLLVKKPNSYISTNELGKFLNEKNVKSKYGKNNIPVKKVAEYFGVEIKRLTINKIKTLYVVGLAFKK